MPKSLTCIFPAPPADLPCPSRGILIRNVEADITAVLKDRSLRSKYRDHDYPAGAPFYLYGSNAEAHLDHVLVRAPNIQLSAENVAFEPDQDLPDAELQKGMIAVAEDVYEASMQPFGTNAELRESQAFFFRPGATFTVSVYADPNKPDAVGPGLVDVGKLGKPLAKGKVTLGDGLYVDSNGPNRDPFPRMEPYKAWKEEFDKIGKAME